MEDGSARPYDQIGDRMVEALPELAGALEDYHAEWGEDEPGPYNIACDVLVPALKKWIESERTTDRLRRVFAFVEGLAGAPDESVREFAQVGIVNEIVDQAAWVDVALRFMGPRTRAMLTIAQDG